MARFRGGWSDRWLWTFLLLGLGARLFELDAPLIDQQAWRQTDTAAIARNYYEEGYEFFYPRVDWRGTTPGYVEMNFPLFPFMVACLYGLAGAPHEWLGRLLAALFSTAAAALVYALARRLYGVPWAARLSALLFLIFPLSIFFGRAFVPAAAMIFLSLAALLSFARWLETQRRGDFVLAALSAALCFLIKIPTLYLGFPLLALAWERWGRGLVRRPALWLYLGAALAPAALWYWHASRLFVQTGLTFGIWNRYGYDKWSHGLLLSWGFYAALAERFWHSIFTPAGSVLVLLGLAQRWPEEPGRRRERVLYVWMAALVFYVLLIPEGNRRLHYYQMPFVPVGALLAAKALVRLRGAGRSGPFPWRGAVAALAVLAIGAYNNRVLVDYYRPGVERSVYRYYQSCQRAGRILDRKLPSGALLVVGDWDENAGAPHRSQSPTLLYYCHRKGWQLTPGEFSGAALDSLARRGATHFVAAAGLAAADRVFWRELLRRGISLPGAYPRRWHDDRRLREALKHFRGAERHIVVVPLGPEAGVGNPAPDFLAARASRRRRGFSSRF